jgi:hypothetical protein
MRSVAFLFLRAPCIRGDLRGVETDTHNAWRVTTEIV